MRFILSALLCLLFTIAVFAQKTDYLESNNLRIDPQWLRAVENAGTGWTFDATADAAGNSYATGVYSQGIYVGDTLQYLKADRQVTFYMICRDPAGQLQWIASAGNWSQGKAVAIAANGDIVVAGIMNNKSCIFYGAGRRDSLTLEAPYYYAAFFIRFGRDGHIIKGTVYATEQGVDINELTPWNDKGFIVAGVSKFRLPAKPAEVKNAMMILRLDNELNVTLEKKSTPVDHDVCFSASADKAGNIYFATYFSKALTIDDVTAKGGNSDQSAIGKLNKKGVLQWLLKSPGSVVRHICATPNGNVYVTGSFRGRLMLCPAADSACPVVLSPKVTGRDNVLFAAALNTDGGLQWCAHGESDREFILKDSYTDNKGNTYLAVGTGGSIVYNAAGTDSLQVNANSSACLKYDKGGALQWLKAFNKNYAYDYWAICADEQENVIVAGQYDNVKVIVGDSVWNSRHNNQIMYAFRYGKADLENKNKHGKVVLPAGNVPKQQPWTADCQCKATHDVDKEGVRYGPGIMSGSLPTLYDSTDWRWMTGTNMLPQKSMNHLFYHRFVSDVGTYEVTHSLTIMCRKQVVLQDADSNFMISLTPCTEDSFYTIDMVYHQENPGASRARPTFNWDTFDPTNIGVFRLLMSSTSMEEHLLLRQVLTNSKGDSLEGYVQKIAKKYHIDAGQAHTADVDFWKALVSKLSNANLHIADVAYELAIAPKMKAGNRVNDATIRLYDTLLNLGGNLTSTGDLYFFIYPRCTMMWGTNKVRFIFPSGLLCAWDTARAKPVTDSGLPVPFSFLVSNEGQSLDYRNNTGWEIKPTAECIPAFCIGQTGIICTPSRIAFVLDPYEWTGKHFYFRDINELMKRRDLLKSPDEKPKPCFMGFQVRDGALHLPAGAGKLALPAMYSFSDRLFAAEIVLPAAKNADGTIMLQTGDGQSVALKELMQHLKKAGISNAVYDQYAPDPGKMVISFVYTLQGPLITISTKKDERFGVKPVH